MSESTTTTQAEAQAEAKPLPKWAGELVSLAFKAIGEAIGHQAEVEAAEGRRDSALKTAGESVTRIRLRLARSKHIDLNAASREDVYQRSRAAVLKALEGMSEEKADKWAKRLAYAQRTALQTLAKPEELEAIGAAQGPKEAQAARSAKAKAKAKAASTVLKGTEVDAETGAVSVSEANGSPVEALATAEMLVKRFGVWFDKRAEEILSAEDLSRAVSILRTIGAEAKAIEAKADALRSEAEKAEAIEAKAAEAKAKEKAA